MDISERLLSVYSTKVKSDGGRYVIEIPKREVSARTVSEGDIVRVALLNKIGEEPLQGTEPTRSDSPSPKPTDSESSEPSVVEGDQLSVEITDLGTEGDGLTTIGNGYVVIVPGTTIGDEVTIEMTTVRDNVGFAEVVN